MSIINTLSRFALSHVLFLGLLTVSFMATGLRADTSLLPMESPQRGFVSTRPAETWEQGLLTGNGTVGANVFARPLEETIIFTHERLFLPQGDPHMPPPQMGTRLYDIRRLIDRGLYSQAAQLASDLSEQDGFMYPDPFVPAFDMKIDMTSPGTSAIERYRRGVNFENGLAGVQWKDGRGVFERRMMVSRADDLAAMQIRASKAGSIHCTLDLTPRRPSEKIDEKKRRQSVRRFENSIKDLEITADGRTLTFRNTFANAYPGSVQAVEGVVHVRTQGGKVTTKDRTMIIDGADEVTLLVDVNVIYRKDHSRIEQTKSRLAGIKHDFETLLERHARIHGEMFNRMRLEIGGEHHDWSTEKLLAASTNEKLSRTLIEKEFDAARYNIICSTGELPPVLQGIWAGTYVPSWASDFTHNGNVPSAIAAMLMGNTPELMLAYTNYMESIVGDMRVNARNIFGARGIVLPSRSSARAFNNALAPRFAGGFWVAGAPWAAHFFYDYYLYTGDKKFLAEHALPFMEEAAVFFEDYLYEGPDGKYVFNPTQSPENTPSNTHSQATFNATMSVAAVKQLLRNLIEASQTLGVNEDKIPQWRNMLAKMPPYLIDEELGVVKEWLTPKLKDNLNHRHSSQLYPVYYTMSEEVAGSEKLQNAFKRIVEIKLEKHWKAKRSGFMSFGLVQLGQAATTLGDGDLAYRCLRQLVNRYWLNNLASMHNHRSLLNMDISGGMPAVIIKMLVASAPGRVQLLPALPKEWPAGAVEGVLCRGQIEVERLRWGKDGIRLRLRSGKKQTVTLEAPQWADRAEVAEGDATVKAADRDNAWRLSLPADRPVELTISAK